MGTSAAGNWWSVTVKQRILNYVFSHQLPGTIFCQNMQTQCSTHCDHHTKMNERCPLLSEASLSGRSHFDANRTFIPQVTPMIWLDVFSGETHNKVSIHYVYVCIRRSCVLIKFTPFVNINDITLWRVFQIIEYALEYIYTDFIYVCVDVTILSQKRPSLATMARWAIDDYF